MPDTSTPGSCQEKPTAMATTGLGLDPLRESVPVTMITQVFLLAHVDLVLSGRLQEHLHAGHEGADLTEVALSDEVCVPGQRSLVVERLHSLNDLM